MQRPKRFEKQGAPRRGHFAVLPKCKSSERFYRCLGIFSALPKGAAILELMARWGQGWGCFKDY